MYLLRQFGGFLMAVVGALILATGYTENQSYLPFGKNGAVYFSLAFIVVGAVVHELRPYKARSTSVLSLPMLTLTHAAPSFASWLHATCFQTCAHDSQHCFVDDRSLQASAQPQWHPSKLQQGQGDHRL